VAAAEGRMIIVVDGGGSTTSCAAFTGAHEHGRTELPSCKPATGDMRTDELCRYLGSWLITTHLNVTSSDMLLVGMSGIWSQEERRSYADDLDLSWSRYVGDAVPRITVISDIELVQLAALNGRPGIVLVAGTGAIALGIAGDGKQIRVGGWGPRIDDAGSGFWIGREALRAVAWMLDGRGPSTLLIRPVAAFLMADPADVATLQNKLRTTSIDRCARLAQAVFAYAAEGDAVAMHIRDHAARELARLVTTACGEMPDTPHDIVLYGSLWRDEPFYDIVHRLVRDQVPDASLHIMTDVLVSTAEAILTTS